VPPPDSAIYRLAGGLALLGKFALPVDLDTTTRLWLERTRRPGNAETATDIRSVRPRLRPP
jgi:hypothetical protein